MNTSANLTYGLMADIHLHNWSKFEKPRDDGINSRLAGILGEIERCAAEVSAAGGNSIIIAGDLFHARGKISPSVFNPAAKTFEEVTEKYGVSIYIIPGNHDLEGRHTTWISSAVETLSKIPGVRTLSKPDILWGLGSHTLVVPWIEDHNSIYGIIEKLSKECESPPNDLIIHAPIDGVLPHLSGGLDPMKLRNLADKLEIERVFAGHYHNHKEVAPNVYSIGALAHHTWSDVGSKAGFLIVSSAGVQYRASRLPSFVDITGDMDSEHAELMCDGNYVRAKVRSSKMAEVEAIRKWAMGNGAKGVEIITVRDPVTERTGSVKIAAGGVESVEKSIASFVQSTVSPEVAKEVEMEALKTFAEAEV